MTLPNANPLEQIQKLLGEGKIAEAQELIEQMRNASAAAIGDNATAVGAGGVSAGDVDGSINTGIIQNFINNRYEGPAPKDSAHAQRIYLEVLSYQVSHLPLGAFDANQANPNAVTRRMQLEDVFIRLDTTTQVPKRADEPEPTTLVGRIKRKLTDAVQNVRESREGLNREDMRPMRVLEAAGQNASLVITGEPGSGKSTVVNFLIHCLARCQAEANPNLPEQFTGDWPTPLRGLLPVRVILRDFEVWLREQAMPAASPALLRDFIAHTLRQQKLDFADAWIGQRLDDDMVLLVLDGLDEVTTVQARLLVRDAIQAFATRFRRNRFLITCRTLSYQAPDVAGDADLRLEANRFPAFELAPLDDEKINDFIEAWHKELARTGKFNEARAESLQRKLTDAIRASDLRGLARNPLQLTLMAWVHTDQDELPDKRARLYVKAVELLLWKWELQKQYRDNRQTLGELAQQVSDGRREIEIALRRAAYKAHAATSAAHPARKNEREALADVDEADLRANLARLKRDPLTGKADENWARDVVEAIKERSGLLARRGENKLTFPHRTFQEFLAGLHLLEAPDFVDQALEKSADLTLWREPILLAVGYTVYWQDRRDLATPLALARRLCQALCEDIELRWKRVWLAGEVLREVNPQTAQQKDSGTFAEVQRLLTQLITAGQLQPVERARAGNVLAQLGDPRFDAQRWYLPLANEPLLGFVEVPEGPFFMGTRKRDFEQVMKRLDIDTEKGLIDRMKEALHIGDNSPDFWEREIWPNDDPIHVSSFFIARYPTTVAQFRAFVVETGFKVGDDRCLRDADNCPVRFVSWHEAMAYCDWLTETLKASTLTPGPLKTLLVQDGWRVTLPSEAEWEKAARGGVAQSSSDADNRRIFPWGDELPGNDANDYANIRYAKISDTCVVGSFQKGDTSYGCKDMVGNVWEWTRSLYGRWDNKKSAYVDVFAYPYDFSKAREDLKANAEWGRVLRGGAFYNNQRYARCAFRHDNLPGDRVNYVGFRIVVSPFFFV